MKNIIKKKKLNNYIILCSKYKIIKNTRSSN